MYAHIHANAYMHTCIYAYIYMYLNVCASHVYVNMSPQPKKKIPTTHACTKNTPAQEPDT